MLVIEMYLAVTLFIKTNKHVSIKIENTGIDSDASIKKNIVLHVSQSKFLLL